MNPLTKNSRKNRNYNLIFQIKKIRIDTSSISKIINLFIIQLQSFNFTSILLSFSKLFYSFRKICVRNYHVCKFLHTLSPYFLTVKLYFKCIWFCYKIRFVIFFNIHFVPIIIFHLYRYWIPHTILNR
jgi:hypothetical protein